METPLLASQNAADAEPLLSLGPYVEAEDDPSPLERIIAESAGTPLVVMRLDHASLGEYTTPHLIRPSSQSDRPSDIRFLVSVIAGSFWLLHCGLVWGSYATDSWSDTHLRVTVNWSFLPNSGVDVVLRSMNLASVFVILKSAQDEVLLWLVFLSALVVPCMMTLLFPMWICNDHLCRPATTTTSKVTPCQLARLAVESCIRIGFAVVYHFLLLDLVMYPLEWNWTGTTVQILNQARGGLIAYVLGISSALMVIIVLRATRSDSLLLSYARTDYSHEQSAIHVRERATDVVIVNGDATFDLYALDHHDTTEMQQSSSGSRCSWWKRFLALQIGLVTLLLWVPAMALPLFRVTYGGLISNLMKNNSIQVYAWQIPIMLWNRGIAAGSDAWMLLILGAVLIMTVLILPLVTWSLACSVWGVSSTARSHTLRKYLFVFHPTTCGLLFTVMSIQTIRKISTIGNVLFDDVTSAAICKYSQATIDEVCLSVTGELDGGIWYLLAQSFVLEAFVWLTLWFSH